MARADIQQIQHPATYSGWHRVGLVDLAKRAFFALVTWQARISDRAHLRSLDARMLKDMGLTRDDVRQEVSKPFWRV